MATRRLLVVDDGPFAIRDRETYRAQYGQPLVPHEQRVLDRILHGLTYGEVAYDLRLRVNTVRNYMVDAFAKTGTRNAAALAARYATALRDEGLDPFERALIITSTEV